MGKSSADMAKHESHIIGKRAVRQGETEDLLRANTFLQTSVLFFNSIELTNNGYDINTTQFCFSTVERRLPLVRVCCGAVFFGRKLSK